MPSTSSLYSPSSCSPILLVRHYIQDCHVQKVTVHAGVLLSDATALSSPRSPDVVLGERVLRMLISCPECHRIPLTHSVFMFGTIEDTPSIIRTQCNIDCSCWSCIDRRVWNIYMYQNEIRYTCTMLHHTLLLNSALQLQIVFVHGEVNFLLQGPSTSLMVIGTWCQIKMIILM